ncbi:MAG: hypothetical protein K0V04_01220 [Deltaproteobacteria bacterium]|nr:hypothetical protein [Deltaproteobacteria bacterium]
MIDTKTLLFAVTSVALLGACKSGPAKVCAKIDALATEAAASGDASVKTMADEMKKESSTCLPRMKAMAEKDPETFKEAATCVEDATALRGVVQCFFKAAMKGKTLPGDTPKVPSVPAPAKALAAE